MNAVDALSNRELTFLRENGVLNLRDVGGVLCATQDYLTTRAVLVDVGIACPYERRYCYQDRAQADAALAAYTDPQAHPSGPWIKVKGRYRAKPIDALNPAWPDRQPWDEVAP